jgi:hypothetical protein
MSAVTPASQMLDRLDLAEREAFLRHMRPEQADWLRELMVAKRSGPRADDINAGVWR